MQQHFASPPHMWSCFSSIVPRCQAALPSWVLPNGSRIPYEDIKALLFLWDGRKAVGSKHCNSHPSAQHQLENVAVTLELHLIAMLTRASALRSVPHTALSGTKVLLLVGLELLWT